VEGLWLFALSEPADPVLLKQKNQIARQIPQQQQTPRMTNVMRIPIAAATTSPTISRSTSISTGLQVEEL